MSNLFVQLWEGDFGGTWISIGSAQTLSYVSDQPGTTSFRVTVIHGSGESLTAVTSAPLAVTWTAPSATPTPSPTPTPEPTPAADLTPSFSAEISALFLKEGEDAGETVLPEADGGDGELTYSLTPDPPAGLSYAVDTRTLSGTPTAAGDYTMTYTVADEDGDEAAFTFTITVQPPPPTARFVGNTVPGTPTVTRIKYSEPTNPGLRVSWTAPQSTDGLVRYEMRFRKNSETVKTYGVFGSGVTSFDWENLEAGATYHVQIRARFEDTLFGDFWSGWSSTGSGTANRPPAETTLYLLSSKHPVDRLLRSESPISDFFSDPDADTLTFETSSNYPGVALTYLGGDPLELWAKALNPATATITYAARDEYGGYVEKGWDITGTQDVTHSVFENSPAGTLVGSPVTGVPYDDGNDQTDDSLTYTLTGDAANAFTINSSTGQVSLKQGAALDYETKSSYTGQVRWTVQGQAAVANLTINVVDLEAGKPDAPTVTRTEFSEPTAPALDVSWTAPDANGTAHTWYEVQYRKQAAQGGTPAEWTPYGGPVLQKKDTSLRLSNLEAGATYEVQVRAQTDDEGPGPWSDAGEGTANRPPTKVDSFNFISYAWDSSRSVDVASHFADADGDTLRYAASSEYPGVVSTALNGSQFTTSGLNPGSSQITYGAHDGYGGYVSHTFTCTITANETLYIREYSPAGTKVGNPVAGTPYDDGDPETDDSLTHTLAGEAADAFVIDAATGQITVKQGATLDYGTKASYTGTVTWTVQGQTATVNLTIHVIGVVPGKPGAPTLTRTPSSEPMDPALDVAWTAAGANGLTITGYQVQYRKKAAAGEEAAAWTPYTEALSASATGATLPDLDAGATYEAQVRAVAERPQQPDITLSLSRSSFDESSFGGDSRGVSITVTATRQGTSGAIVVDLALSGTATGSGTDYRVRTLSDIPIADGHTSGSRMFVFTGVNDTEDEGSESIIVSGTVAGLTVKGTVITIIDDERPGHVITAVGERSGPWSDTGEGTANRPPTASSANFTGETGEVGDTFIWNDEQSRGSGGYFQDADGDTLTYSASAQHPALLAVTFTHPAGTATLQATLLNPGTSKIFHTARDAYGGQVTRSATITITADVSREIAENSAGGTNVGDPVTGTPYNGVALTYTLTGSAATKFAIDSATGQISVKEGRRPGLREG